MKKVTIITGLQGAGKTRKAEEMVSTKKSLWLDSLFNIPKMYDGQFEVIVIDGVIKKDVPRLMQLVCASTLTHRKPYTEKENIYFPRPEVIATMQSTEDDFLKYVGMDKKQFEEINVEFINL